MQLHELPKFKTKKVQRVARGGKRGTYSGRGVKGQKSRSGRKMRPAERDLFMRLPKRRGFKNPPKSSKPRVFNLGDIAAMLKKAGGAKGAVVDQAMLGAAGLLPATFHGSIKILGGGTVSDPITLKGFAVSKSAREKVEKAGGKIEA